MSPSDGDATAASDPDRRQGRDPGFDEQVLYVVVREAVEDAILGVLGTLMLLGIAFVLIWAGGAMVVTRESIAAAAVGIALVAFGLYLAASSLEVIPPVRDWF